MSKGLVKRSLSRTSRLRVSRGHIHLCDEGAAWQKRSKENGNKTRPKIVRNNEAGGRRCEPGGARALKYSGVY